MPSAWPPWRRRPGGLVHRRYARRGPGQREEDDVAAAVLRRVPVLVAYNIPFRDCAQYSAGGALDTASTRPGSTASRPASATPGGRDPRARQPRHHPVQRRVVPADGHGRERRLGAGARRLPEARFAQLNYAVDSIETKAPQASVYLDGTHSDWLSVGEPRPRRGWRRAGVMRAQGFFTNVSNYQHHQRPGAPSRPGSRSASRSPTTPRRGPAPRQLRLVREPVLLAHPRSGAQPRVNPDDPSTWTDTDQWFDANMGTAVPTTHFVVDTSRNGKGPLDVTPFGAAPYDQPAGVLGGLTGGNWCNPPGAGLGLRPTASTGVALPDAYLWVKIPGESDGSCDIAGGARAWDYSQYDPWGVTGDAQNHFDPLWGMVDPPPGPGSPSKRCSSPRTPCRRCCRGCWWTGGARRIWKGQGSSAPPPRSRVQEVRMAKNTSSPAWTFRWKGSQNVLGPTRGGAGPEPGQRDDPPAAGRCGCNRGSGESTARGSVPRRSPAESSAVLADHPANPQRFLAVLREDVPVARSPAEGARYRVRRPRGQQRPQLHEPARAEHVSIPIAPAPRPGATGLPARCCRRPTRYRIRRRRSPRSRSAPRRRRLTPPDRWRHHRRTTGLPVLGRAALELARHPRRQPSRRVVGFGHPENTIAGRS